VDSFISLIIETFTGLWRDNSIVNGITFKKVSLNQCIAIGVLRLLNNLRFTSIIPSRCAVYYNQNQFDNAKKPRIKSLVSHIPTASARIGSLSSSPIPLPIKDMVINTHLPHDVSIILFFKSYATGNPSLESDLGLIVSFHSRKDLFDLGGMREDLIDTLGIRVDLLGDGAIRPHLKDRIKDEAVGIYSEE
jgi:uncharacterized protein